MDLLFSRPRVLFPILFVLSLLPLLVSGGCGEIRLPSRWLASPTETPKVDGDPAEWRDSFYSLLDGALYAAAANDEHNLYLCLAADDPVIMRQVLGGGLTVWFEGGRERRDPVGIRFPLGARQMGARMRSPDEDGGLDGPSGWAEDRGGDHGRGSAEDSGRDSAEDSGDDSGDDSGQGSGRGSGDEDSVRIGDRRPGGGPADDGRGGRERGFSLESIRSMVDRLNGSDAELEVLAKEGRGQRMFVAQAAGVDVHFGWKDGTLTYELRVPLLRDPGHPYAAGARPGEELAVRLETPKIDVGRRFSREGSRGGRGRFPGGGGPGRGPGSGRETAAPRALPSAAGAVSFEDQDDPWGRDPNSTDGGDRPLFPEARRSGPPERLDLRLLIRLEAPSSAPSSNRSSTP